MLVSDAKNGTNEVGYGNPPQNFRFKRGRSGNPRGRPKGVLNLATVLARTLREKVTIDENGKRKTVSKLEAAIVQLVSRATSGDAQAIRYLCQLVKSAEERSVVEPTTQLSETDQKVMANILKRFQQSFKEKNNGPHPE
jgi:dihydrodipicolinate synthase/N-acetylneuraminate lyase